LDQLIACFEGLKHPPAGNAGLHDLHELLVAPRTVLSGGQGTAHIAAFAAAKGAVPVRLRQARERLAQPRHFSRLLDPKSFRAVFQRFMARFSETVQGVVASTDAANQPALRTAETDSPLLCVRTHSRDA